MKILISVIIVLTALPSFAQTESSQTSNTTQQSIIAVSYRLFPTQNIWTFIRLNTRNGRMKQVQFGMEDDRRLIANLNSEALVTSDKEVNDRFTLYPTQNIYTFILLDQFDGRAWQVQWSIDPENRGITPIE